jgi:polysaccharide export outer membrane protein
MKPFFRWMLAGLLGLMMGWANAADFTLGPGDVVKVSIYGSPDLGVETRISETGTISFPLLGQVDINGLNVATAEKKLGSLLESGGYLKKPQVNIIVTQIQSRQVSVLGQVNRPGRFPLEGKRTVMDVLALAGGFSADGGDVISLIRKRGGNVTKTVIDVVDMVRTGELSKDLEIEPDDIIYAERSPRFYIYGEVQRPGAFRLERQMTVIQALAVGGGLTPRGTERGIRVKRRGADGREQIITVKHDDVLQIDDVVYVKESWF